MLIPRVGDHTQHLQESQISLIVEGYQLCFTMRRAAGHAGISPYLLDKWMKQGDSDLIENKQSLYAQLFISVSRMLSYRAAEYIKQLERLPKNFGAIIWLLSNCLRDDYGNDSNEYKELVDLFNRLAENVKRLQERAKPMGAITDGRKVDTEGNQEEGLTP